MHEKKKQKTIEKRPNKTLPSSNETNPTDLLISGVIQCIVSTTFRRQTQIRFTEAERARRRLTAEATRGLYGAVQLRGADVVASRLQPGARRRRQHIASFVVIVDDIPSIQHR